MATTVKARKVKRHRLVEPEEHREPGVVVQTTIPGGSPRYGRQTAPLKPPEDKRKRHRRTVEPDELRGQLLVSRKAACKLLGNISVITITRLEEQGVLRPVRLNKQSETSQVFYRMRDIRALAEADE